jgi:trehalose utilization protein
MTTLKVTIWNEYRHERQNEHVAGIYPRGIHNAIGDYLLQAESVEVTTATLDEPEHGLTDEVLANTDVLLWWGHLAHGEVRDDIVEKVRDRVLDGMGLIVLHSGHASKIFERLLGTKTGTLKWRDDGERERVWVIESGHPIAEGLGDYFEIPKEEMYGERFECLSPGSKAEKCSAAAVPTAGAEAKSSTSVQAMRLSPSIISPRCLRSSAMPSAGLRQRQARLL